MTGSPTCAGIGPGRPSAAAARCWFPHLRGDRPRRDLVPHIMQKFDGGEDRSRYAARILPTLKAPDEVWMPWYDSGEYRKRYVKVWDDDRGSMTVVTESKDGALLYNFIPGAARSLNRQRTGVLLHPRSVFSG